METFFAFDKKNAKSIKQLSKKKDISVNIPQKNIFFTSFHNRDAIKEMKEGN